MSREERSRWRSCARPLVGAGILAALVWWLGSRPFLDGLGSIDAWSVAAASGLSAVTTVGCAWRWSLVARGLGVGVPLRAGIASYYRSQFLNTTLPGGVLGDVHRGVHHGRATGDVARGLRAVAWERIAGQVVQVLLAVVVLLILPSPARSFLPAVTVLLLSVAVAVALLARVWPAGGVSVGARFLRAAAADVRAGLLPRRTWPGIVLASAVVVACQALIFLIAARAAGSGVPTGRLLPLALLVLVAMAIPLNIAGWGPREGAAAWAFGAAGLSASDGVSIAVVYGVLVLVASLPGAVVLAAGWLQRSHSGPSRSAPAWGPVPARSPEGASPHG